MQPKNYFLIYFHISLRHRITHQVFIHDSYKDSIVLAKEAKEQRAIKQWQLFVFSDDNKDIQIPSAKQSTEIKGVPNVTTEKNARSLYTC